MLTSLCLCFELNHLLKQFQCSPSGLKIAQVIYLLQIKLHIKENIGEQSSKMMYYEELKSLSGLISFCLRLPPAFTALFYRKMSVLEKCR